MWLFPLSPLLLVALWSLLLSSVAGQVPIQGGSNSSSADISINWSTGRGRDLPYSTRGSPCWAPRVYPYTGVQYPIAVLQGYSNVNGTFGYNPPLNLQWDGFVNWELQNMPGSILGSEGGFFHYALYPDSDPEDAAFFIGGGRGNDRSGRTPSPAYQGGSGNWTQYIPPENCTYRPLTNLTWNWTYTAVVDTLVDDSYIGVIYGGWVVDPTMNGSTTFVDNTLYVIETNASVAAVSPISASIEPPYFWPRQGVAMASFNATAANDTGRGNFVMIGGREWPTNRMFNDVLVASSPRPTGAWTNFGPAPFSPRYAAQAFEDGRRGVFLVGGLDVNNNYLNDVWRGQFGQKPSDPLETPTWRLITAVTGTAPTSIAGCAVSWWYGSALLRLTLIASATDTPFNGSIPATKAVYWGDVTFPSPAADPTPPVEAPTGEGAY